MSVELILIEDVQDLGTAGQKVNVADGYARNYLLPRKLALKASKAALRQLTARMARVEAKRKLELEQAQLVATKIAEAEVTIPMKAGEDDKLFGSVTTHSISDELKKVGVEIDHHKVVLEKPIKELGAFNIDIKLHPEVTATARVWVVRD